MANSDNEVDTAAEAFNADLGEVWETIHGLFQGFISILPKLLIAVVVFIGFIFLAKGVGYVVERMTHKSRRKHIGEIFGRISKWILVTTGLLVAITIVAPTVTPGKLLTTLGIGGVAIGFAFKDILQNFFAGILIMLQMPFDEGDQIRVKDHEGTVLKIETRSTLMRTYDGRDVVIPNYDVFTSAVLVNTARALRRSEYEVGIGYADDAGRASKVILDALKGIEEIATEPKPDVLFTDIAGSALMLRVRWWSGPRIHEVLNAKDAALKAIKRALDEAEIDIPYSTHTVLFHDQTDEYDGDRNRQREGWPAGKNPPQPARHLKSST